MVFGVRRFHQYLYGRRFTLLTDHRPLTTILGPKRRIPPIAAARLQRWAVQLAAYTYDIQFKSTHDHGNADALSRLPLQITGSGHSTEPRDFNVCQILSVPLAYTDVQHASRRDPVISRVLRYTQKGWPAKFSIALKPFSHHRNELSIEDDCLLWGTRVIIPLKLREELDSWSYYEAVRTSVLSGRCRRGESLETSFGSLKILRSSRAITRSIS